eukprot:CAMPEP_0198256634 /NCGR_PEP_ID=MMETSP1447-20131203/6510_1 /TAXON_ID=420782 /ORGANISM="Chaetoceros dichaeta, Strain CCMP1751" /LENGTH=290 /DNA_ID=CAMNT_0043943329 /DNA_START=171 /DNA_END=1043 /DNA_ORIENTATION=-
MTSLYYDIDAILAEEELIPVTNLLDFQYLAHLDRDAGHQPLTVTPNKPSNDDTGRIRESAPNETRKERLSQNRSLPEGTKFKMPLWAIDKWSELSFVRLTLPRHFGRRARERLEADPAAVDLRRKSERFFMSGIFLVDLIKRCVNASNKSSTSRRNPRAAEIIEIERESNELKQTLFLTYTGARLRRTFDWTLSNIEDDVSAYTERLTEMERRLFRKAAAASHADAMWKLHGSRRIHVSTTALRAKAMATVAKLQKTPMQGRKRRVDTFVTPEGRRTESLFPKSKMARAF